MGKPKQLLTYHGITLLRHAVRTAMETGFAPVVVVLGAEAERCRAEIADLPVHPVVNVEWEEGMGTSIRAGLAELVRAAPEIGAALILLHDQPLISAAKIAKSWPERGGPAIARSLRLMAGRSACRPFLRENLFGELTALFPDIRAQDASSSPIANVRVIEMEMPEALDDIDTPEDYERLG